ncbi:hypothetical protein AAFF_G00126420 [Aldrovandia affinis]|uniref:C2H2-type domain-containing protein n=1 Tax=Aldrovandia affinis TaxID=143900 RepID=A0AAD7W9H2_9TELE|nr:hypothetical protein AAFF_G00126420 [Aldrovandia affinis]
MELCQVSIKVEGDKAKERDGVKVKEEEQESEINGTETLKYKVLHCRQCGVGFSDGRARRRHVRLSHPEEYQEQGHLFQCPVCGDSFVQSHALVNHQRRHVHQSCYTCQDCLHTCHSLTQLLAHRRTHALDNHPPPRPPAVATIGKPLQTSQPPSPFPPLLPVQYKCPHCNFLFRDAKTKMRHMNVKHPVGCALPLPLLFSVGQEEEREEKVVMAVQIKEEDEKQVKHEEEERDGVKVKEEEQESDINGTETLKSKEYQEQVLARSRLRCHLCGLPCPSSRQLIEHQRSQHPLGRPFQCPVCGDSFIQSHALLNHQRRHVNQSRYTCRDCPHTCRSLAQLLAHRHIHVPANHPLPTPPAAATVGEPLQMPTSSLQCPQCFITFRDLQTSQQHMRLQHPALYEWQLRGRTVFACRRCDHTFPSSRQLSAHQRAHRQGQEAEHAEGEGLEEECQDAQPPSTAPSPALLPVQYKCPHCNFLFRDAKTKMRHMNVKHPPGCTLPLPLLFPVGQEEEREEKVVMAVQIKEEDEKQVKHEEDDSCTVPSLPDKLSPGSPNEDRGEEEEGEVKVQIKLDPGDEEKKEEKNEGACECALCGKGFEQLFAVARQRRRGCRRDHPALLGPQDHACGHCGQLFHSQEALQQHQRLHTLERPYHCQHCGNTFKRASGLQRHKSIHSQHLHPTCSLSPQ